MEDPDIHEKLYKASEAGDDTRVTELLGAGADPDKYKDNYGDTALIEAARQGKDSTVSILIQHGADLNIQNKDGKTIFLHKSNVIARLEYEHFIPN